MNEQIKETVIELVYSLFLTMQASVKGLVSVTYVNVPTLNCRGSGEKTVKNSA